MNQRYVYRVMRENEWRRLLAAGEFTGDRADNEDGYIHLSAQEQVDSTITVHFGGADDIVVLEIDAAALGSKLKWEVSRDGQLFPHLYDKLPMTAVSRTIRTSTGRFPIPRSPA